MDARVDAAAAEGGDLAELARDLEALAQEQAEAALVHQASLVGHQAEQHYRQPPIYTAGYCDLWSASGEINGRPLLRFMVDLC